MKRTHSLLIACYATMFVHCYAEAYDVEDVIKSWLTDTTRISYDYHWAAAYVCFNYGSLSTTLDQPVVRQLWRKINGSIRKQLNTFIQPS